jgi:hypothetical protein
MNNLSKYLTIGISSLALASTAVADSLGVVTGSTTLTLSSTFAGAVATGDLEKIKPGKVSISGGSNASVSLKFPISGGVIDTADLRSEITHSGGFSITLDEVKVSASDFVISIPESSTTATLSALITVNGEFAGRVDFLSVNLTDSGVAAPLEVPANKTIKISDAELKLTAAGALALNAAFSTTLFTTDTVIATAKISAITSKKSL